MQALFNGKKQYKYLLPISMLYVTLKITTIILIYKIINLGTLSFTASTLLMPFWFFLGTIVTETYGYNVSKQLIWMSIICQLVFATICTLLIYQPSALVANQEASEIILGRLPRVTIASSIAIVCGAFANAYVLAKYKILAKGKSFWIRGIKSSAIGELVFTIIAYLSEFLGIIPFNNLIQLMLISFVVKIALSPILIYPSVLTVRFLKRAENVDVYDYNTNFNPFQLSSSQTTQEKIDKNSTIEKSNVINFCDLEHKKKKS